LSLAQVQALVLDNDQQLSSYQLRQQGLRAQQQSQGYWSAPRLGVGMLNVPLDSLSLSQEPMTQMQVTLSQALPRGNSIHLKQQQSAQQASAQGESLALRRAELRRDSALLWLDIARATQVEKLVQRHEAHFRQLRSVVLSRYGNASNTRAQDLLRLDLELERLSERLLTLKQARSEARARLNEWLPVDTQQLPLMLTDAPEALILTSQDIIATVEQHPAILLRQTLEQAAVTAVELARQDEAPQWQLNAAYGYRGDDMKGDDRADFVSLGVSVDLPWAIQGGTRHATKAKILEREALAAEREQILRHLLSQAESVRQRSQLQRQRLDFYDQRLLPQLEQQRQAVQTSYANNDGDFTEVIRAEMDELNGNIERLNVLRDWHQSQVWLGFYLTAELKDVSHE
jgi:outer membrane protein TolC